MSFKTFGGDRGFGTIINDKIEMSIAKQTFLYIFINKGKEAYDRIRLGVYSSCQRKTRLDQTSPMAD